MKVLLIFILTSLLLSCNKDDYHTGISMYGSGQVGIRETNIPDTVTIFDQVQISAKAEAINGCWSDLYFNFNESGEFEYSLEAYGKYTNLNGVCPDIMVYKDTMINFQPTQKGKYFFNVSRFKDSIIVDTMIVK